MKPRLTLALILITAGCCGLYAQELSGNDMLEIDSIVREIHDRAIHMDLDYFKALWGDGYISYIRHHKPSIRRLREEYNQPHMSDAEILDYVLTTYYTRLLEIIIQKNIPETYKDRMRYQDGMVLIHYPWDGNRMSIELKRGEHWTIDGIWINFRF